MRLSVLALLAAALVPNLALAAGPGAVGYRQANDFFGQTLALDGDRLAVGVDGSNTGGFDAGLVHVYVHEDGEWQLEARLQNPDEMPANGNFGRSVALAADTLVVSATTDEGRGVVHTFRHDGEHWRLQASLDDPDTDQDQFGRTLALAGDTLAIGSYARVRDRSPLPSQVSLFRRDGDAWAEEARIDLPEDRWNHSLALGDGTLLVSSSMPSITAYRRTGGVWRDDPSLVVDFEFLLGVAIDGDTALMLGGTSPAALVYRDAGAAWSLDTEIDYSRGAASVSLNALALDGDWAAFGFTYDDADTERSRVALWHRQDGGWQHAGDIQPPSGQSDFLLSFGTTVAVAPRWLAVGAPRTGESTLSQSGLVYVYANAADLPEVARLGPDDALPGCGCRTGGGPMGLLIGLFALGRRRRSR